MQAKHGLYVVSPDELEAEGIYLEQFLCYINRATPAPTAASAPAAASALAASSSSTEAASGDEAATAASGGGVPPTFYCIFTFREPKNPSDGSRRHTFRDWQYAGVRGEETQQLISGADGLNPREMLRTGSVNIPSFAALADRVVAHFTAPYTRCRRERGQIVDTPTYAQPLSAACRILPETISVFDFSTRECLRQAGMSNEHGQCFLPIGDALQEPFWPEGLGVNRGIHNALDAVWVANKWAMATELEQRADVLAERQHLYQTFTAPLNEKTRGELLKTETPEPCYYHADPDSRYVNYKDGERAFTKYVEQARSERRKRQRAARDRERSRSPRRGI